jgi:plastocyanin
MIPRWLALLGTVILVIVAVVFFTRSDNPTLQIPGSSDAPQVKGAESGGQTVVYTGESFVPQTVHISAGEQVVFVNNSPDALKIASDPFPYDNDLPELNAHQDTPMGRSYSYAYPRAGTFGYHNELNPSAGGSVIVGPGQ